MGKRSQMHPTPLVSLAIQAYRVLYAHSERILLGFAFPPTCWFLKLPHQILRIPTVWRFLIILREVIFQAETQRRTPPSKKWSGGLDLYLVDQ